MFLTGGRGVRIELEKLDAKGSTFAHAYEPEELVLDEDGVRLTESPEVNGRAYMNGREVHVRGRIRARAEVECSRCLSSVEIPVETAFDVTYVPATDYEAKDAAELLEEDLNLSVFEGEAIDIDDLVREQLLLALPARALCQEECKGLCPVCGGNKNMQACECEPLEIDPRWAALKNLVNDS